MHGLWWIVVQCSSLFITSKGLTEKLLLPEFKSTACFLVKWQGLCRFSVQLRRY
jgi:hypothetical protein